MRGQTLKRAESVVGAIWAEDAAAVGIVDDDVLASALGFAARGKNLLPVNAEAEEKTNEGKEADALEKFSHSREETL